MNLETLQPEAVPEGEFWHKVVGRANLQPEQRHHVHMAFTLYKQARGALLMQQQHIVQQLQAVMGATHQLQETAADQHWHGGDASAVDAAVPCSESRPATTSAAGRDDPARRCSKSPPVGGSADDGPGNTRSSIDNDRAANGPSCSHASGSSSGSGSDSRGRSCSYSDASAASPSSLTLEAAEQADELLQRLMRIMWSLKQHSRRLCCMWINLLTAEQHTNVLLSAYPHHI